jgi:ethanolamine permease
VIVVGIGGYLGAIFETPDAWAPLWWALAYAVFVGLNVWGVEASFRFTVGITLLALAILAVFYVGALTQFDLERFAFTVEPDAGAGRFLPHGLSGVFAALPFAVWFYLAIEQLPLAAEESHDPAVDMPRGILLGLLTLVVCAFLTLVLSAGMAPGAAALGASDEPLFDGLRTIFGTGLGTRALALVAVAGLVASFHAIIFAYGRQIFSLSRAGYFPRWLSRTHTSRETPHVALIVGAVISYVLQMLAFLLLRLRLPNIARPYRSPLGISGALAALAIAALTLVTLFVSDPVYQRVVLGAAVWFALGMAYFAIRGRHQLVYSPEEAFAVAAHAAAARGDASERRGGGSSDAPG